MKKLFENEITISVDKTAVQQLLLNPDGLWQWNPAISRIEKLSKTNFVLYRNQTAINQRELVSIHQEDDQIIYRGVGAGLSYRLIFRVQMIGSLTKVNETFFVIDSFKIVPLALLKPIVKRTFYQNLFNFKVLAEQVTKM